MFEIGRRTFAEGDVIFFEDRGVYSVAVGNREEQSLDAMLLLDEAADLLAGADLFEDACAWLQSDEFLTALAVLEEGEGVGSFDGLCDSYQDFCLSGVVQDRERVEREELQALNENPRVGIF